VLRAMDMGGRLHEDDHFSAGRPNSTVAVRDVDVKTGVHAND